MTDKEIKYIEKFKKNETLNKWTGLAFYIVAIGGFILSIAGVFPGIEERLAFIVCMLFFFIGILYNIIMKTDYILLKKIEELENKLSNK